MAGEMGTIRTIKMKKMENKEQGEIITEEKKQEKRKTTKKKEQTRN